MSHPPAYKNDISMKPKPTKKAAAKRKPVTPKSYNVADLRSLLQQAAGTLIAIDQMIDRMIKDKQ